MAFFSFFLKKDSLTYLSDKIEPNQKYYSKDITLWKELNNRNKKNEFSEQKYEIRKSPSIIGKKILICLPPNFGLGDAIEYGIAIQSLIKSEKFFEIAIAFCSKHLIIFKQFFPFLNLYPVYISESNLKKYDTIFHVTLEIDALKFQKYKRSNIAKEICNYFKVSLQEIKFQKFIRSKNYRRTISIYPVSTSVLRSLPYYAIEQIVKYFKHSFHIKIIIDNSLFSQHLETKNKQNRFLFIKPKNIQDLMTEVSKTDLGVFVDSGPFHLAKLYNKKGVLIETSVSSKILLDNYKKIIPVKNHYFSNYCNGPCGLVDVFQFENHIGCYETNKISFNHIKVLKSFKNLQRWNKKQNNSHFISNPVSCVKKINIKNIIELIKAKTKEF